jgi:hypothetical protein
MILGCDNQRREFPAIGGEHREYGSITFSNHCTDWPRAVVFLRGIARAIHHYSGVRVAR